MDIFLLRHGIAEDHAASDAERDLTADGRQKIREIAKVLKRAGVRPSLILSSPYRRALATARIAAEVLECAEPIIETRELVPDGDPGHVWEEVRAHRTSDPLLLVGHQPLFGDLAAFLLGAPDLRVDFKKGAVLALEMPGFGVRPRGILKWMLTARLAA
ncbi:MAG: phosphohistidine phosphatase SixA [Acidobacteria bacterium]|nr:phosphohistidine phosphatase SixA [Acidobacteriota bacterium]